MGDVEYTNNKNMVQVLCSTRATITYSINGILMLRCGATSHGVMQYQKT